MAKKSKAHPGLKGTKVIAASHTIKLDKALAYQEEGALLQAAVCQGVLGGVGVDVEVVVGVVRDVAVDVVDMLALFERPAKQICCGVAVISPRGEVPGERLPAALLGPQKESGAANFDDRGYGVNRHGRFGVQPFGLAPDSLGPGGRWVKAA